MAYRLAELARIVGGTAEGDGERRIEGLAPLDSAGPRQLSFLAHPRYRRQALDSAAGALLVGRREGDLGHDLLRVDDPYMALAELVDLFHPEPATRPGAHPTAVVADDAAVDPGASLGAYAVVGPGSRVDAGARLHPHAVVGAGCEIGAGTELHPGVVVYDGTRIGRRCILHAGVVVGSDGYGYASRDGEHRKIRQVGRVVIEDDVEIGANTTVDRAALEETRIGAGSKLDNLVQVGHNVRIGRGSRLVSQVGIAGSTRLGERVDLAGQVGVSGHLELGDGVQVAGKSAVFGDLPDGARAGGIPAVDLGAWRRQQALARRLPEMWRRLKALERAVEAKEDDDE